MCIRDRERFHALRVNSTTFNLTLKVTYTGGGNIEHFGVQFHTLGLNDSISVVDLVPVQDKSVPYLWFATITDILFVGIDELLFEVSVCNAVEQCTLRVLQGEIGMS